MRLKIKRAGDPKVLHVVEMVHDMARGSRLGIIRPEDEPTFIDWFKVPEGSRALKLEIKGMQMRFTFYKKGENKCEQ